MRILISTIQYAPQPIGVGKYAGEMAEWLANQGHNVRVVTAPHYYPQWRICDNSLFRYTKAQEGAASNLGGASPKTVLVFRCPLWVPKQPKGLSRLAHLLSFAASSLPVMLGQIFWSPDVVLLIEPTLICAPHVLLLGYLCGAKTWLHVQDFEIDAAFELGQLRSSSAREMAHRLERSILRSFDRVSTISIKMLHRLREKGVERSRRILFPNWVECAAIFPKPVPPAIYEELGVSASACVVLYAGNLGEKQGLDLLAHAAGELKNRSDIQFVVCGNGSFRNQLIRMTANLPNIRVLPLWPAERLNDLLNAAHVHVLPQKAGAADLVMPSKLNGMLASGRPVVATAIAGTELADIVSRCGIVTPPGNVHAFVAAIQKLAGDPSLREQLGDCAREYAVKHLDRMPILKNFEENLKVLEIGRANVIPSEEGVDESYSVTGVN